MCGFFFFYSYSKKMFLCILSYADKWYNLKFSIWTISWIPLLSHAGTLNICIYVSCDKNSADIRVLRVVFVETTELKLNKEILLQTTMPIKTLVTLIKILKDVNGHNANSILTSADIPLPNTARTSEIRILFYAVYFCALALLAWWQRLSNGKRGGEGMR